MSCQGKFPSGLARKLGSVGILPVATPLLPAAKDPNTDFLFAVGDLIIRQPGAALHFLANRIVNQDREILIVFNRFGVLKTKLGERHSVGLSDEDWDELLAGLPDEFLKKLVTMHQHPNNSPPSRADILNHMRGLLKHKFIVTDQWVYWMDVPKRLTAAEILDLMGRLESYYQRLRADLEKMSDLTRDQRKRLRFEMWELGLMDIGRETGYYSMKKFRRPK